MASGSGATGVQDMAIRFGAASARTALERRAGRAVAEAACLVDGDDLHGANNRDVVGRAADIFPRMVRQCLVGEVGERIKTIHGRMVVFTKPDGSTDPTINTSKGIGAIKICMSSHMLYRPGGDRCTWMLQY